jgi:hypothetical protein
VTAECLRYQATARTRRRRGRCRPCCSRPEPPSREAAPARGGRLSRRPSRARTRRWAGVSGTGGGGSRRRDAQGGAVVVNGVRDVAVDGVDHDLVAVELEDDVRQPPACRALHALPLPAAAGRGRVRERALHGVRDRLWEHEPARWRTWIGQRARVRPESRRGAPEKRRT